jgi:hypothetical protein
MVLFEAIALGAISRQEGGRCKTWGECFVGRGGG